MRQHRSRCSAGGGDTISRLTGSACRGELSVLGEIAHLHDLPSKSRVCASVVVALLLLAMT